MSKVRGFTLVELLVVVSIIAILSVVGIVVYSGIQQSARDTKRKADVQAIAKSYEIKYQDANTGVYQSPADADFASGKIPKPPEGGDYFNVTDNSSGFKVCAALEKNPSRVCNTPAADCYCQGSIQGAIPVNTPPSGLSGTHTDLGSGFSALPSCSGDLNSGLVGYWKMDDYFPGSSSDNSLLDSSGNNHNGTTHSSSIDCRQTGKLAGGCSFGSDGSATFGNWFAYQTFTISMWVNPGEFQVEHADIIDNNHTGSRNWVLQQNGSNTNQYQFATHNPSGNCTTGFFTLTKNVWQLVTVVRESGRSISIYLNGSPLLSSDTGCNNLINYDSQEFRLGNWGGGGRGWRGLLDDVRVYNKVLSPSEIQALYNNGSGCI